MGALVVFTLGILIGVVLGIIFAITIYEYEDLFDGKEE